MSESMCVEVARFELQSNHTMEELIIASDKVQSEFLQNFPGFLKRELLHLGGAGYLDIVHWKNAEAVQAAIEKSNQSPAAMAYFSLMNPDLSPPLQGRPIANY